MITKLNRNRNTGLIVDLLMLVIGINVALWFEGWFEDRRDADTARQYLVDIRQDLQADIKHLDDVIRANKARIEKVSELVPTLTSLAEATPEQQSAALFAPSSYMFFQPSNATYRSMMESGDFRLLSDAELKRKILNLDRRWQEIDTLENNFLQALDDEYIPIMMSSFDIMESRIKNPDVTNNLIFRNFFIYTIQDTNMRVQAYELALAQSQELLDLLPAGES